MCNTDPQEPQFLVCLSLKRHDWMYETAASTREMEIECARPSVCAVGFCTSVHVPGACPYTSACSSISAPALPSVVRSFPPISSSFKYISCCSCMPRRPSYSLFLSFNRTHPSSTPPLPSYFRFRGLLPQRPVIVKLNSGVDYRGVLACLGECSLLP